MIKTLSLESMPEIRKQMKSLSKVAKEAYVYGSLAKGLAVPGESDADLLVIPKRKTDLDEVYALLNTAFESLISSGLVLHVIIYSKGMERLLEEAKKGIRIV